MPLNVVSTSSVVKTFSISKCITRCVSRVDAFIEFKSSFKYSLYRKKNLFSSIRMLLAESSMEYVTLNLLLGKRRIICQNTLFAEK